MFDILGIDVSMNGKPVFWMVFIILSMTYAVLGYVAARLYEARKHIAGKNEVIQKQFLALKKSQEKTLQYEKLASIGRLAAGVAHEVRNPLGVIRSAAGLIYEEGPALTDNAKKSCDFIQKEIVRLDHFIEQLLGFSMPMSPEYSFVSVLESELFGHEKGAFTGAHVLKQGVFERANGGTLFLDEIGETSGDFQAKLLRVIQERQIQRVGSSKIIDVDFRLIVATNRNLQHDVATGGFREDLYYRLNVIPICIPPLRDRPEDILPLAILFLDRVSMEQGRKMSGFSDDVIQFFLSHSWPGNVRELENIVERGAVLSRTDNVEISDLGLNENMNEINERSEVIENLQQYLDIAARQHICDVLDEVQGARKLAAKRLGIERTTLYRLIKKYEILN